MKSFLLGVGAQKAGTSWLHSILSSSMQADFGFTKEYHIFNQLGKNAESERLARTTARAKNTLSKPHFHFQDQPEFWTRVSFLSDTENYFNYFQCLLANSSVVNLTGDLTPIYCGLEPEMFEHIRDGFGRRGIATQVLFSMRDPAQRCFSAIKMEVRNQMGRAGHNIGKQPFVPPESLNALVFKHHTTHPFRVRTDYEKTISNIESVFASDSIHYAFYETLFSSKEINRLEQFLGIHIPSPDFEHRVNQSFFVEELDEETEKLIAQTYRTVYEFVARRFTVDFIRSVWPSSRFVL